MSNLIDITHTVKASAAPSEGARYMFDPATGERYWVGKIPELTVPVEESPAPSFDLETFLLESEETPVPEGIVEPGDEEGLYKDALPPVLEVRPSPEVPPVPMPTLPKSKKVK